MQPGQDTERAPQQQCAVVENSVLSVAVALGEVNLWPLRTGRLDSVYALAPHAARPWLRWLMQDAGFTRRELHTALGRGLLVWSEQRGGLVYGMTWRRHLAAALIGGVALGFAGALAQLIWHGAHSVQWGALVTVCGVMVTGALYWLQRHYFAPRGVALRVLGRLERAPVFSLISKDAE